MGQQRSLNIHDESLISMLLLCFLGTFFFFLLPVVVGGGGGSGCGETDRMLTHLVHLNHT